MTGEECILSQITDERKRPQYKWDCHLPNSTAEEMATVLAARNMNCDQNDKESMFKSKTPPHIKSCLISYRFNFRVQNLVSVKKIDITCNLTIIILSNTKQYSQTTICSLYMYFSFMESSKMIDLAVILVIKDKYDINDKFINTVLIERFFWHPLYAL